MSVKDTSVHKKKDVSSGEAVDQATRGEINFGVDKDGKAYPLEVNKDGETNATTFKAMHETLKVISMKMDRLELHLDKITELNQ